MTTHRHRQILRALAKARRVLSRPGYLPFGMTEAKINHALHSLEARAFQARADGYLRSRTA